MYSGRLHLKVTMIKSKDDNDVSLESKEQSPE